jgi:hypothetical protein
MCLAWRTLWGVRVLGTLGSQIRKNYQAAATLSTFALSTRTRTTFPISLHIPSVFATLSPRLLYSVSPFHICIYLLSRSCLQHCLQIFLNQWLVHMPKVFINSMRKTTSHFCRTFILFRIARRTPFKWNSKSARSWLTQPAISRTIPKASGARLCLGVSCSPRAFRTIQRLMQELYLTSFYTHKHARGRQYPPSGEGQQARHFIYFSNHHGGFRQAG